LLRVEACGLCGTDHEQFTGELFPGRPFVPGHETVGVIEEIGPTAAAGWGVGVGDRVAVEVFRSCGSCDPCRSGLYRRCDHHGLSDMYGFVPVERPPGLWGGYAELLYLGPGTKLLPVPPAIDPVDATLFNPVGAGIRWGATLPGTGAGDLVVVLGPGIRGLAAAAAAKEAGADFVMVTGLGRRDRARLEAARSFGADLVVEVGRADPLRELLETTGRLADVVVDVTAKAPSALGQAVALARPGGTVVLAGTRGSPDTPGFRPDDVVFKELRLLGALGVDIDSYRAAFDLIASGRYPFTEVARRTAGFSTVERLLRSMAGESDEMPPIHGVFVPEG
jgi:alcohol dehydrogenase